MNFRDFPRFDDETAAPAARAPLAQIKSGFGAIPEPLTRYANSPAMLSAALGALEAFERTSLTPLEREVLAMTMGRVNSCQFCISLHRRLLQSLHAPPELVGALEAGAVLSERRLEALRRFVLASLEHHGDVPSDVWSSFREVGFSHAQALEVLMGISAYTLTTLANRLTETSE